MTDKLTTAREVAEEAIKIVEAFDVQLDRQFGNPFTKLRADMRELLARCAEPQKTCLAPVNDAGIVEYADEIITIGDQDYRVLKHAPTDELDRLRRENEWLRAAHWLIALEGVFVSKHDSGPFFATADMSTDGLPLLSLNMGDTFSLSCADAEPFRYEDAPELLAIAKRDGWPGLVRWVAERRKQEPHPLVSEKMKAFKTYADGLRDALGSLRVIGRGWSLEDGFYDLKCDCEKGIKALIADAERKAGR